MDYFSAQKLDLYDLKILELHLKTLEKSGSSYALLIRNNIFRRPLKF